MRRIPEKPMLLLLLLTLFLIPATSQGQSQELPRKYVAYQTAGTLNLDGRLDEPDWQNSEWTEDFADIEGFHMPVPRHRTRAKILYDEQYLYIGAELSETDIWATYTEDETVIFHENNFEVFIDPDGDTHNYYELEVNALGTKWDLLLVKPYIHGGPPVNSWEIIGLKVGVHHAGTINNPADTDTLWSVELALPWEVLRECAPRKQRPSPGDQWRINFSRVEWQLVVDNGQYTKRINPETGKPFPENNWIWSPQGVIDMHRPDRWGFVQFSGLKAGEGKEAFAVHPDEPVKTSLRKIYEAQGYYFHLNRQYAGSLEELFGDEIPAFPENFTPEFEVTPGQYLIRAKSADGQGWWKLTEDSKIWK
jgi:hypothetical protein